MQVIIEEKVAVVTTGAGNPGPYIEGLKASGCKVFPVVASVALARRLAKSGVDGLIAEGGESGGHVGETTTMSLVPQVVKCCIYSSNCSWWYCQWETIECSAKLRGSRRTGRYLFIGE